MDENPRKKDLKALALMLADEANERGVVLQTFIFLSPVLDLPGGDSIRIEIRREKQAERVHLDWLHIRVPAGVVS